MQQIDKISREDFLALYEPLMKGYSESFKYKLKTDQFLANIIFQDKDQTTIENLHSLTITEIDPYIKSFILRLLSVRELIHCRDNNLPPDLRTIWDYVANSITAISTEYTISSIGSQGFLSIPLYKSDKSLEEFDFLRLHIWDDSLNEYMDQKKCNDFSIHSHTFNAKSWIITGKVINDRYDYEKDSEYSAHSFFEVKYNDSINEVNQHTSKAINKNVNAQLTQLSQEVHFANGFYEIEASKLHKSGHLNSPFCSATFFSFTGKEGLGESFVIGPKEIQESEINRKTIIDPTNLIEKINKQIGQ